MKCAWDQLLAILPQQLRSEVDRQGKNALQELRLRLGQPIELVTGSGSLWLKETAREEHMAFIVNTASRYSPWASATVGNGYITAPGGHRIGLCGECVMQNGMMTGIRRITSLCVRVARDFPGIAERIRVGTGSVLLLGPPGSGKTTLLRDLIRQISQNEKGSICVVDERGELFPQGANFEWGRRTDVLTGCGKPQGVMTALKTMGPGWIAVDEITAQEDCQALLQAGWCGVKLLATAHAADRQDLFHRKIYEPLAKSHLFCTLIVLQPDKSWRMERMDI